MQKNVTPRGQPTPSRVINFMRCRTHFPKWVRFFACAGKQNASRARQPPHARQPWTVP
jgi:hypothetical protein